jgi:hypothetical protein
MHDSQSSLSFVVRHFPTFQSALTYISLKTKVFIYFLKKKINLNICIELGSQCLRILRTVAVVVFVDQVDDRFPPIHEGVVEEASYHHIPQRAHSSKTLVQVLEVMQEAIVVVEATASEVEAMASKVEAMAFEVEVTVFVAEVMDFVAEVTEVGLVKGVAVLWQLKFTSMSH